MAKVPLNASDDITFADHTVFEFHGTRLYTDAGTLANEKLVMDTRNDDGGPAIAPHLADAFLAQQAKVLLGGTNEALRSYL
ncbi:hypothetical protein [Arthrobacter sp. E3]|uniref:hypothetical protein n=1 Tax=Arthrobacter sp. E3 TaxID=517402 RepID=UPI001A94A02E|nr:hypothetical protein [Arthrobacter sp. E3]